MVKLSPYTRLMGVRFPLGVQNFNGIIRHPRGLFIHTNHRVSSALVIIQNESLVFGQTVVWKTRGVGSSRGHR